MMNLYVEAAKIEEDAVYFYNMDTNINTTGKRIKYLRITNGWNGKRFLEELRRQTGEIVKPSALSNHEKDTSMPAYPTLIHYAEALGTTTDFLLLVTDDPTPAKKTDRNVVIEAKGEEERRILEEIASLLEEMNAGDLRFVLDIVRRISALPLAPKEEEIDISALIETILDIVEQLGGKPMREKAEAALDEALYPSLGAGWRRPRFKRHDKKLKSDN